MAIEVSVGEPKTQEVKSYPKLMIATKGHWTGMICLFFRPNEGVLLPSKHKCDNGYASNFNMSEFADYNEEITLKNE